MNSRADNVRIRAARVARDAIVPLRRVAVLRGLLCVSVAVLAFLVGCASVTVRKVPSPTQYNRWTDHMQKHADQMEGIRFYLPRPFITVFESFPIRTDIYLAHGEVDSTGNYVIIREVRPESGLSGYMASPRAEIEIPITHISRIPGAQAGLGEAIAGAQDMARRVLDAMVGARTDEAAKVPIGVEGGAPPVRPDLSDLIGPPGPTQPTTGANRRDVRNDNAAFAYQPLRGNFDIVYLPDFEEQYVVSSVAGLGNAQFELNLGQGWSLQGFNSLADNSELNRRIFHLIDTAMRLAQAAGTAALGLPPLPGLPLPPGMTQVPRAQAGEGMEPVKAGTPVSLKIVVVHYAAKGLYPIIKPRELQERQLVQDTYFGVFDLFRLSPQVRMASEFDPNAIQRAMREIDAESGSFTVPRYPYQYVSFNTFRYMAIEVVEPSTDGRSPFEHLYDKTGTTGPVGEARTGEIDVLLKSLREVFPPVNRPEGGNKPDAGSTEALGATMQRLEEGLERGNYLSGDWEFTIDARVTSAGGNAVRVAADLLTLLPPEGEEQPVIPRTEVVGKIRERAASRAAEAGLDVAAVELDNIPAELSGFLDSGA